MPVINYIEKHLKTFSVTEHKHKSWEIIYVTQGNGTVTTENDDVIHYEKGDTIVIPPDLKHTNYSSVGFKNIYFTIDFWNAPVQKPQLIPYSDLSLDFYKVLKLAYRYFHQFSPKHPINLAMTVSVEAFLNHLLQQSETHGTTQIIIHEIINRYTDTEFDLEEAYRLVPLCKEHLRKLFIKENGCSPSKFLMQKRLTLAKQLLSNKNDEYLRINEIAAACGFSDTAYFCRVFKKETGSSPSEFQTRSLETP